jgi:hypothetical protein
MLDTRTEAESLAIALELGLIEVADAVRWADERIAEMDLPETAFCDLSMSSKAYPQDVAHLLRTIAGEPDQRTAVREVLRRALEAIRSGRRTPECVARALFGLAIAGDLPTGRLKDELYLFDAEFDAASEGHIVLTREEICSRMIAAISQAISDEGQ